MEFRDWLLPMLINGQATIRSPDGNRDVAHYHADGNLDALARELGMVAEEVEQYKTK